VPAEASTAGELGEAFISPDEAIPDRAAGVSDDAFIAPDEPIPQRPPADARIPADAFISPDEPIVRVKAAGTPDDLESVELPSSSAGEPRTATVDVSDDAAGMVTGMGMDAHLAPEDMLLARFGDPHVADLVEKVGLLADALRQKGESALRTTPEMSRFEATLRAYCVGYLAGRRAEDEPA